MAKQKRDRGKIARKLLNKYRLVILNEETFEERFALKLTRLNVFVILSISGFLLIGLTILLIAFTPLREYVPGYSSTTLKRRATELNLKTDSLQRIIAMNEQYYESIRRVLTGDFNQEDLNKDSIIKAAETEIDETMLSPSREDSLLRARVDKEDKYSLFESATTKVNFVLFPPVTGTISETYDPETKHYAVDVVVPKDTPVKSVADGIVIFSEWTSQTGYVILIDHSDGLLSVYKHNSALTKEQGDLVKAGEVIAISGNAGELTTGPHLHFELWSDGYPIDPTTFIDFE
ncbi:MAG: M23 family metallopeptidase [Bacteroidia bacterium]|nr:M23 family metallopeptidase [Bacteroidia bacterium]MBT8268464.1 M23 family metallopeptidase [Bacteroidia bacterium]NNF82091.1 M23 family metallopeptidase [Flavobacteriaceae bacterium]NNK70445.1 M23 family metallopeptidase [Flavobacteriaceae bacterium]NNL80348.1 M23 family metallopeptidase [Flavobacteriaceae bacterium]